MVDEQADNTSGNIDGANSNLWAHVAGETPDEAVVATTPPISEQVVANSYEPVAPIESPVGEPVAGHGIGGGSGAIWPVPSDVARPTAVKAARRNDWRQHVGVLLVAALVAAIVGHYAAQDSTPVYSTNVSNSAPTGAILSSGISIPTLVQRVTPAVVSIDVKNSVEEDQGTGMILTSNGLIVTNNHVIAAAEQDGGGTITVTRSGQSIAIRAVLVGTDPSEDVALIRAEGVSGWPTVTLGNSNKLATGDSVVAIGNALGLAAGTPTVTDGIVSALGRTVTASDGSSSETLHNMIQTNAAINPGNSGGPLLDAYGQVIGMNTAVAGTLADGENAQNIGFAIPVEEVRTLLPGLEKGGTVTATGAYLGVEIETMTPSLAQSYGFTTTVGALVVAVVPGSGAAAGGIEVGDIFTNIDGHAITSAQQVTQLIQSHRSGQKLTITLVRNGSNLTLTPTLGSVPNN
jgi:S1-C subfamily serine protease